GDSSNGNQAAALPSHPSAEFPFMPSRRSKQHATDDSSSRFRAAFERVRAEILAVPPSEIIQVNVDVAHAVTTILGALPAIAAYRVQFKALPEFDFKSIDRLEDYALAAMEVHCARPIEPPSDLPELKQEGSALRARLYEDAEVLVVRRLMDPRR